MRTVIHAERIGKQYRLGERGAAYGALRDSIATFIRSPLQWARGSLAAADQMFWALNDVSFDIGEGEVFGLIGRNGSGKSTLLKILSRITEPTTGRAHIVGRVGSLLEVGTGFHPELTGRENVFVNGAILGMRRRDIARQFDAIVAFAGVERFIDTPVKFYSSGMQVRLAFAVAAHLQPNILLVDEVLAVGDAEFQKRCLGKMHDVSREGRTIILVSHQMNQIRRLCRQAIWLDHGAIRAVGPVAEVIQRYEHAVLGEHAEPDSGHCFRSWEVAGRGHLIDDTDNPLTLRVVVELKTPVTRGHFGLALLDSNDSVVAGWAFEPVELAAGTRRLDVRLPHLPVRPGSYRMLFALFNAGSNLTGGSLIEKWVASPPLTVATMPVGHPQDEWAGVLNVPATLSLADARHELRGLAIEAAPTV